MRTFLQLIDCDCLCFSLAEELDQSEEITFECVWN